MYKEENQQLWAALETAVARTAVAGLREMGVKGVWLDYLGPNSAQGSRKSTA